MLASYLVEASGGLSPWMMLSLLILITSITTEFISNNAVVVLSAAIVIGIAEHLGIDPRPFVVGVMFAASASFATPIGYQTNTLVYSAGNYRFTDFARLGIPLNLLLCISTSVLIPLFWPLAPLSGQRSAGGNGGGGAAHFHGTERGIMAVTGALPLTLPLRPERPRTGPSPAAGGEDDES